MPQVMLVIYDSRLPGTRQTRSELRLTYFKGERTTETKSINRIATIGSTAERSIQVEVELKPGQWDAQLVSLTGRMLNFMFEVSVHEQQIVVSQDLASLDPQSESWNLATRDGGWIKDFDKENFQRGGDRSRRFVASRGNFSRNEIMGGARIDENDISADEMRPKFQLHIYQRDVHFGHHNHLFSACRSFDERFNYWMRDWRLTKSIDETKKWEIAGSETPGLFRARHTLEFFRLRSDWATNSRVLLEVKFGADRYLLVLPHPWSEEDIDGSHDIEIDFVQTVDQEPHARIKSVRIWTGEPSVNGVLQCIESGDMALSKRLWLDSAYQMLQQKYQNPINAAAGAMLLVQADSFDVDNGPPEQHSIDWIYNLRHDFPWLPEGSICLAWVLGTCPDLVPPAMGLRHAPTVQEDVSTLFKESISRGVPYYTESLRLLSKGLEWADSQAHTQIDDRLAVRWLSMNIVNAGPFLVIHDMQ